MANNGPRKGPVVEARRMLLWLGALIVLLTLVLAGGTTWGSASWAPKLGLDLEGGTQMILAPRVEGSAGTITDEQREQAVSIIRQRVDGSGVAEAQITTQGSNNLVVALPGTPTQEQRQLILASAAMSFRPVIQIGNPTPTPPDQLPPDDQLPQPSGPPQNASDPNWVTPQLAKDFLSYDCSQEPAQGQDPSQPMITCDAEGTMKFILGPVEVTGQQISESSYGLVQGAQGATMNQWGVNLTFNAEGTATFREVTTRLNGIYTLNPNDPRAQFAIVLDGKVISAPRSQAVITDGRSQITGNFTETTAKALSEQLKFGALPISFEIQSEEQISATLGAQQLELGLIAGLIGLILVVIYTLIQYRALGLVTVASLVVAGILTYLAIVLLGWTQNYRLSLAGIAGLIIAIGQTADSFIVYFERIRDELREGRGLVAAVENGWQRARRTVIASKAVNLLAAIVLYFVAVGNVQGFAFTLGLTAIADLIVVFLFTHPMLRLLATRKFFAEGHRLSGFSPERLGVVPFYRGAGRTREAGDADRAAPALKVKNTGARGEAERRQTIAERRLAERQREKDAEKGTVEETPGKAAGKNAVEDSTKDEK
ncbi:protein translocase subunit SecD [Acaricomes phytoseiuli]|uniref:protein translocase subunit SecD n=1 Tax=Acaricomes phytoseiuli TaxID=291968 RepID=UPI0003801F2C|nr:protein translocase subunit SecD [Acaricomes phytoseiuli]MCW1249893.1 protein translocase subunit SecD [Acaricomes phytoseiuli]